MAIDTPHFAYPFRLDGTSFAVDEQDSDEEILECCRVVLATEVGSRDEEPDFGTPLQVFRQGGADLDEIEAACTEWEPRSSAVAESEEFQGLVQRLRVSV